MVGQSAVLEFPPYFTMLNIVDGLRYGVIKRPEQRNEEVDCCATLIDGQNTIIMNFF